MKYPVMKGKDGEFRIEDTFMPRKEGVFVKVQGWEYPYNGFPMEPLVDVIAMIKGQIPTMAESFKMSSKFFLIFQIKALKKFFWEFLFLSHRTVWNSTHGFPLLKRYNKAVREIYRIGELFLDEESDPSIVEDHHNIPETKLKFKCIRDLLCLMIEADNAYRYRLQDLIEELNIEAFCKNPLKEVRRLLDILIERENSDTMADQWVKIKKLITPLMIYLFIFQRKYVKRLKGVIRQLNKEEVKFQPEDCYWIGVRVDYKWELNKTFASFHKIKRSDANAH